MTVQTVAMDTRLPERSPCRPVRFGDVGLNLERREDGVLLLSAARSLTDYEPNLMATFWRWGDRQPDAPWVARREAWAGQWEVMTYGEGRKAASSIAQWLRRHAPQGRPVLVLSENSPVHAAWMFGAMAAGVPICSVSTNYARLGPDFDRLKHVVDLLNPGVIFAESGTDYSAAVEAIATPDMRLVGPDDRSLHPGATPSSEVMGAPDVEGVRRLIEALDPTAPARYLLTSGSTGTPKAAIHTQAMMSAHAASGFQAMGDAFAWDGRVLDWLPWSHIAGSSLLTNVSSLGGSLFIDDGRPTPAGFSETLKNLLDCPPTFYGTMPTGYAMLADALEKDEGLRAAFFSELRALLFGGAGLPQVLHDRIQALAVATIGQRIAFVSGYGSTETASAVSYTWWDSDRVGMGLPTPGVKLKLVPCDGAYEVRVKGPSVTPGYLNDPARSAAAFDDEGYFKMEDLADFHDRERPELGLFFAGRRAEQFKMGNGTFVQAGQIRDSLLAACPGLLRDLVVCGDGRDRLGVLVWLAPEGVRALTGGDLSADAAARHPAVIAALTDGLSAYNQRDPQQSRRVAALIILSEPPSSADFEISDKGSINRAAVLKRRADAVERLYADRIDPEVIVAG
ncbi:MULTISPECIES: AMP-binding protein [unclassified Brevundimonas]|nr:MULTISPECIES: AMP-binding protein [unclassified Brevundimonas]MCK6103622.1 AMP-binding protein [Brevundimonas sp. EYE_349]HBI19668.1 acyl-CoA synthetase [Brevundimonas sp.]